MTLKLDNSIPKDPYTKQLWDEESVSEAAGLGSPSVFLFLPPALCDVTVSISGILLFFPQICRFMMPMLVSKVLSGFKCFKTCQHEPEYSISAIAKIFAAFKVFLIQATSMMYVGLTMTSAAQFQMLRGHL